MGDAGGAWLKASVAGARAAWSASADSGPSGPSAWAPALPRGRQTTRPVVPGKAAGRAAARTQVGPGGGAISQPERRQGPEGGSAGESPGGEKGRQGREPVRPAGAAH